ncbi:FAD-dependent oxidoreductase [Phaeodactylibacter xiamenensis]|uniref:FAD-dependent oxidoreductase n=1 Tax=Phaeodactylibacter xiamenensis TaxID=1524460 RepID=UPI003CCBC4DE
MKDRILIVGAGLVGSLWAVLLAKRGYQVDVFELRDDPRKAGFKGGRSINLAMSDRGWKAMERAGIKDTIRQQAIPMRGRKMHDTAGQLTFQPYGDQDQAIYSVSRGGLNIELIDIADQYDNLKFHFGYKCLGVVAEEAKAHFEHRDTGEHLTVNADRIFGTDGAFSAVRRSLMKALPRFNYSQSFLDYGYKELHIPPTTDGRHALDPHALHIWPRGQFMMIALPNVDGSFTGTLFLAYEGQTPAFDQLNTDEEIMAFFQTYFADAIPLIPNLLEEFRENPTSSLVTIRCSPWRYEDKVLIMGDASHAIVPFYGQGMNSGFEDCTLLDELIDANDGNWAEIIEAFNHSRIKDANAIADLALRNFIEMRDKVADPKFLLRKEIAAHFNKIYPEFLPLYSQVTFSHIPYSEALEEGHAQDALFEEILVLDGIEHNWKDNPEVDRIFRKWIQGRPVLATS